MSRCASQVPHVAPVLPGNNPTAEYTNGPRAQLPVTPSEDPLSMDFSSEASYCQLVEFPKSQVLPVRPSFTPFPVKPAIPPLSHIPGSVAEYTRPRRCAPSDPAHSNSIKNATE